MQAHIYVMKVQKAAASKLAASKPAAADKGGALSATGLRVGDARRHAAAAAGREHTAPAGCLIEFLSKDCNGIYLCVCNSSGSKHPAGTAMGL